MIRFPCYVYCVWSSTSTALNCFDRNATGLRSLVSLTYCISLASWTLDQCRAIHIAACRPISGPHRTTSFKLSHQKHPVATDSSSMVWCLVNWFLVEVGLLWWSCLGTTGWSSYIVRTLRLAVTFFGTACFGTSHSLTTCTFLGPSHSLTVL